MMMRMANRSVEIWNQRDQNSKVSQHDVHVETWCVSGPSEILVLHQKLSFPSNDRWWTVDDEGSTIIHSIIISRSCCTFPSEPSIILELGTGSSIGTTQINLASRRLGNGILFAKTIRNYRIHSWFFPPDSSSYHARTICWRILTLPSFIVFPQREQFEQNAASDLWRKLDRIG